MIPDKTADLHSAGRDHLARKRNADRRIVAFQVARCTESGNVNPRADVAVSQKTFVVLVDVTLKHRTFDLSANTANRPDRRAFSDVRPEQLRPFADVTRPFQPCEGLNDILSTLGAGIGFGLVDPVAGDTPGAGNFGLGAGLWWLVSNLLALSAGGYMSAWLAGNTLRFDGMLHGIVTWGVTLLLTFYRLTTAIGGLIGGAFGMVGGVASGATAAAGEGLRAAVPQVAAVTSVTPDQMLEQAKAYLQPANPDPAGMTPEVAQREIAMAMPKLAAGGEQATQARERIVAIMAAQLQISPADAARRFDEAQAQIADTAREAMQTAKVAADETASAASNAAFLGFVALVLGGAAAVFGGSLAVQRRVATVQVVGRGRVS